MDQKSESEEKRSDDEKLPGEERPEGKKEPTATVRKKRKRSKKAKGAPRRPLSAYNAFFKEQRAAILEERERRASQGLAEEEDLEDDLFAAMGKRLARLWKELTPEQKIRYNQIAEADMRRYRAEMEVYQQMQSLPTRKPPPGQEAAGKKPPPDAGITSAEILPAGSLPVRATYQESAGRASHPLQQEPLNPSVSRRTAADAADVASLSLNVLPDSTSLFLDPALARRLQGVAAPPAVASATGGAASLLASRGMQLPPADQSLLLPYYLSQTRSSLGSNVSPVGSSETLDANLLRVLQEQQQERQRQQARAEVLTQSLRLDPSTRGLSLLAMPSTQLRPSSLAQYTAGLPAGTSASQSPLLDQLRRQQQVSESGSSSIPAGGSSSRSLLEVLLEEELRRRLAAAVQQGAPSSEDEAALLELLRRRGDGTDPSSHGDSH